MNKKVKWILVLLWLVIIFEFSNQPATISDEKSKYVVYLFSEMGINLNSLFGNFANFIVRKTAHFSEYFVLYILLFNALYDKAKMKKVLLIAIVIVFLYACSDEIHQFFIPGRSPRIRDVFIDTFGGLMALLLNFYRYRKKQNVKVI
ncbi:VanZ family protein [Clostridium sp. cel8]|jgi:VanZ family protein|uniref:VanZ family protein n=1 Tax=unclassified Clostridium TaxID=2614128 RepID=UPI0015F66963|nr:VanZ family protein [Clostridium sp. cel8]MBA5852037.1 VanZ family protein [Clostridium sp. cel8]